MSADRRSRVIIDQIGDSYKGDYGVGRNFGKVKAHAPGRSLSGSGRAAVCQRAMIDRTKIDYPKM